MNDNDDQIPTQTERQVIQQLTATNNEAYANLVKRIGGGETIRIAGMVYWNVIVNEEKTGGLAGRATSGMQAKDLALGLAFGPAGVLASVLSDKNGPAKCTCELGIVAVGKSRVSLLKLGRVNMIGESESTATLPSELIDRIPTEFQATKVISFRPLTATTDRDQLLVHILGKPPVTFGSPFSIDGSRLVVCAPDRARLIAAAIGCFAMYPLPEEIMVSFLVADKPPVSKQLESALEDPDYRQTFVCFYKRQREEVRRAWILATRGDSTGVKEMARACGRGSSGCYFVAALGLFFLGGGILFLAALWHDFAKGKLASDVWNASSATLFTSLFIYFGFRCLYGVWWLDSRERRLECRLFERGGGFGGSLDALLALLAWGKNWQARINWNEVETELAANPQFSLQLCKVLRRLDEEKRKNFLSSAPPGLREKLVAMLLTLKGTSRLAAIRYGAVWLPCLVIGIYGAVHGFGPGIPTVGDWFVFFFGIFLGFGGGIPAIVLLILQIIEWRKRCWVRREFPAEAAKR